MPLFLNVTISNKLGEECGIYLFLFFTYIFTSYPQSIHEKNVWTNEIPTKKKYFGRTKYPREETLDSQNAHERNFGPTK